MGLSGVIRELEEKLLNSMWRVPKSNNNNDNKTANCLTGS